MRGFSRIRPWLAFVAATAAAAGASVAAAEASPVAAFAGRWIRTWPESACEVTLEIGTDGRMVTQDGDDLAESQLEVLDEPEEWGFVKVRRTPTHDNGGVACTAQAGSRAATHGHLHGSQASQADLPPGRVPVADILPYAHGDAIALCGFANIGGCANWYSRVPAASAGAPRPARRDLFGAVERSFYALVPENRATFELILTGTNTEPTFPDRDSPTGFRAVACEHSETIALLRRGTANLQFTVSSCSDAAIIDALATRIVTDPAARDALRRLEAPAAEKRRFGIGLAEQTLKSGARLHYLFDELKGGGMGLPMMVAALVDAKKAHAIVVTGVNMDLDVKPADLADNRLLEDPEDFLRALVVLLAKDPDAAR